MREETKIIRQIIMGGNFNSTDGMRTINSAGISMIRKQLDKLETQADATVSLPNKWLKDISLFLTIVLKTTPPDVFLHKDAGGLLMNIHTNKVGDLEILDPTEKKESENSGGNV